MTDTEPYGVRHFLRSMDPEGAADRRRRLIPLLDGQGLAKGAYADLDQFQLAGILVYKTLVLARSPSESRPPSVYSLVWTGRYYDVWQRPNTYPPILVDTPLGDSLQPGGVPPCGEVLRLAGIAGPSGRLAAPPRVFGRSSSKVNLSAFRRRCRRNGVRDVRAATSSPTKSGAGCARNRAIHRGRGRSVRGLARRLVQEPRPPLHRRRGGRRCARPVDRSRL